jgi:hypothetical protein
MPLVSVNCGRGTLCMEIGVCKIPKQPIKCVSAVYNRYFVLLLQLVKMSENCGQDDSVRERIFKMALKEFHSTLIGSQALAMKVGIKQL